jgi:hypothetical protein
MRSGSKKALGLLTARSLRFHGSLHPQFVGPGMLRISLSGPPKRRIQPGRYASIKHITEALLPKKGN